MLLLALLLLAATCVVQLDAYCHSAVAGDAEICEALIHLCGGHGATVYDYGSAGVVDSCCLKCSLGGDGIVDDIGGAGVSGCKCESDPYKISL